VLNVFFLTKDKTLLFIREPQKGLDLIGGRVEQGELPLAALIREVKEETNFLTEEKDYHYLGTSVDHGDKVWRSHVFIAIAPDGMEKQKHVEAYTFQKSFKYMEASSMGRPWQAWLGRHFIFMHDLFSGLDELCYVMYLLWDLPIGFKCRRSTIGDKLFDLIKDVYLRKLNVMMQTGIGHDKLLERGYVLTAAIKRHMNISYKMLENGTMEEKQAALRKIIPVTGAERFEIRVGLRAMGSPWSEGKVDDLLKGLSASKLIYAEGKRFFVQ